MTTPQGGFMRTIIFIMTLVLILTHCSLDKPVNRHYPTNKAPLIPTQFVKLPLGSVKPAGWLHRQLEIQANGLTGHLDEFWPDLIHSAWKGGDGEAWERSPYYLDGLIPLAFLLDDERLIEKARHWVEAILESGQPNGWFGPEKNDDRWPLAVAGKVIQQYYEATGDQRAMDLLTGYFNYLHENLPDWPDSTWRGVRAMEHAVTGYWLFRRTNDPEILETLASIYNNSFDWSAYYHQFPWDSVALKEGRIPLNWKADGLTAHVVNNAMAVKYPGLWYQKSGRDDHKNAVYEALRQYDYHHGQVGGRFSGDEHLAGKRPTQGTEMCAVVEFMFSLENLLEIFGDPLMADRLELLAYNALPGTMTPDGWAHQYDQQTNQVLVSAAVRDWSTNGETSNIYGLMPNYPCCLANMHQGWPKFVQHMWMATHDQGLAAIVYGPNQVEAYVGDGKRVTIHQETNYPFDGSIQLTLNMDEEAAFPLYLRIPQWANGTAIQYRNKEIQARAGSFVQVKESWRNGDRIQLTFPVEIRTERRFNQSLSILRGPLYFALRIGKEYKRFTVNTRRIQTIEYLGSRDWEILPTTPWNYGLVLPQGSLPASWEIQLNPAQPFPFADVDEMIYNPDKDQHEIWSGEAAVVLEVAGRRIPSWQMKNNSADDPPRSPVRSNEPLETVHLVPYGSTRLRIAEFPVLEE